MPNSDQKKRMCAEPAALFVYAVHRPLDRRRFHDFTHILSLLVGALLGLRFTVYVLVVVI